MPRAKLQTSSSRPAATGLAPLLAALAALAVFAAAGPGLASERMERSFARPVPHSAPVVRPTPMMQGPRVMPHAGAIRPTPQPGFVQRRPLAPSRPASAAATRAS